MPLHDSDQPKRKGSGRKFVGQRGQLNKRPAAQPSLPVNEDGEVDEAVARELELAGDGQFDPGELAKLVGHEGAPSEKPQNRRQRRAGKLRNWRDEYGKEIVSDETEAAPENNRGPASQPAKQAPPKKFAKPAADQRSFPPQKGPPQKGPPPAQGPAGGAKPFPHRLGPPPVQPGRQPQGERFPDNRRQGYSQRDERPRSGQYSGGHQVESRDNYEEDSQFERRDRRADPPRQAPPRYGQRPQFEQDFRGDAGQQARAQQPRGQDAYGQQAQGQQPQGQQFPFRQQRGPASFQSQPFNEGYDQRAPERRQQYDNYDDQGDGAEFAPSRFIQHDQPQHNGPPVEIGQELRVGLQSITSDGECIARIDDYVIYVSEGIPGEFVDIQVTSVGRDFARARVRNVASRDRHRVAPKCKHFGVCGGCQWQHIAYPSQLHWKEKLLTATLEHALPKIRFPIRPMMSVGEPWGTRNKIYYQAGWFLRGESTQLLLGHNRLHAPTLEPITECPVHHPSGDRVARLAFQVIRERGIPISDAMAVQPGVKGILVRTSGTTGLSHVVIVATGTFLPHSEGFEEEILKVRGVEGVHLNIQPEPDSTYLGKQTMHRAGEPRLVEEIGDVKFHVSPDAFFQTNHRGAQALYDIVYRMVSEQRCNPILDLYSGVGLFALPLAKRGRTVVAIEENEQAVADGIETLKLNGIQGCHFIANRVERAVKELPREKKFHTVILDPPREGCMEWVLRLIGRGLRPKRIVYVSCNPTALGRDLVMLMQSGYRVDEIQPVDMFPHTPHIESVTLLNRK